MKLKNTQDEIILHSFETLFKVRRCMRTIEKEQGTRLDVVMEGKNCVIIIERGMTPDYSGWEYEINVSHKNSEKTKFTKKSKKCALWLYDNFNIKQQKNKEFISFEKIEHFLWQFLLQEYAHNSSKSVSNTQTLIACLNAVHDKAMTSSDKLEFEALIKHYGVLKEKELLTNKISVIEPSNEQSKAYKI